MVRMLVESCPGVATSLALWTVADALLPVAMLVAIGNMVGRVPAAARDGLSSHAGDRLIVALVVAGALLVLSLLMAPIGELLGEITKVRLTYVMQARLMAAVSGPVGIAHLEDASVLDRVALAQGSLSTDGPADAPRALAMVLSLKLTGVTACVIVAVTLQWWVGTGILVFWMAVRGPVRRRLVAVAQSFGAGAHVLRRAGYFYQLVGRPDAAKETRVFGLDRWAISRYRENFLDGMANVWRLQDDQAKRVVAIMVGIVIVYGTALGVLADQALAGSVPLSSIAILLPMLTTTIGAGAVGYNEVGLEFSLASFPHLDELEQELDTHVVAIDGGLPTVDAVQHAILFDDIRFTYPGSSQPVFEHLSLRLTAGQSTAIVGANGAGKTTLVKLLARLIDPNDGRITVDGIDLRTIDPAAWRKQVAVVFQDFTQYPLSAAANVGFGSIEHLADRSSLENAARRAGALDIIENLPKGWETILSREFTGGTDLSGGQWQRLALARAMFAAEHGAQILVLDEPTAWLDARGEAEFFDQFLEITKGLTTLLISHRFSTVRQADHICVLDHGLMVESGTHHSLLDADGHYARLFSLQAQRFSQDPEAASEAPQ
jgi:ATP-binding cassette subfamily B protein